MSDDEAFTSLVQQGTQMLNPTVEKELITFFGTKERAVKMIALFADRYHFQWNFGGGLFDIQPRGFSVTDRWGKRS